MFILRRWYNQNSGTIWKVTGIVVFLIIILQVFNHFAANKNKNNNYNNANVNVLPKNEYTDLSLESDKSVLSNNKLSDSQTDTIETINKFFSYCNSGEIQKAYELLTDECKERLYPSVEHFKNSYYKNIFNGKKKNVSLENWTGSIYKVEITEDLLSLGEYNEENTRQDYITVKKVEDGYKLNINRYIETSEINKFKTFNDNIGIKVEKKDVYMDYEIYTFKIKNNMDTPILLDNLKDLNSMYLEDKNNLKYSAYTHEISMAQLLINAKETRTIKIKYYSKYGSRKRIDKIVFSKVITDYGSYVKLNKENSFNNYEILKIEI